MDEHRRAVQLSAIDEERFGIKTARATDISIARLPEILDFCSGHDVALLIARCPVAELDAVQAMEARGFQLMDTLVYYAWSSARSPILADTGKATIRPIRQGEEAIVRDIAAESFRGYFGHYHADKRLDRQKCDDAYISWATRSCISRDVASDVLVADVGGAVSGFATLRLNSPCEGEGVLFGVVPAAQGQGIYRSFMIRAMEWVVAQGASRMVVSTQITNIAVQKVWTRVGFEPSHGYYTFHKWFDRP